MNDVMTDENGSPKAEAIAAYVQHGFILIPLQAGSRSKLPLKGWRATKPGDFGYKKLAACNYGIALRGEDLIIDVDPRNFAKGDNPLKRLVADLGIDLSQTFTVKTGGGGLHIYLRKPADFKVVNELKEKYPGVEFKAEGRFVVGPESIHPGTGQKYEILSGSLDDITEAPQALLDAIERTEVVFTEGTKEYKDDAATQGQFISYLKNTAKPSIEGRNGNQNAFNVACGGRDLALPPQLTWELMMEMWNPSCEPPWDDSALKTIVHNAYTYAQQKVGNAHPAADFADIPDAPPVDPDAPLVMEFRYTDKGDVRKCFHNLLCYIRLEDPKNKLRKVFGQNEFTGLVEFIRPAPWHDNKMPRHKGLTDRDLKLMKAYMATRHDFERSVSEMEEAVTAVAHDNRFHPVREYLEGLEWDGTERLNTWLTDYLGVEENDYTRAVARKTLCGAVMRIMQPGIKSDHTLVLEGAQGCGKSTVCKILGGEYYGDFTIDPHSKDTVQLMQGSWINEIAEMNFDRKSETDAIKAFLSRDTDTVRLPYGRLAGIFPRQCVFIASVNPGADGTYLKDETGNRRWWPVECKPHNGQVDFKKFKAVRNQLWAEAMFLVTTQGERLYMDTTALKSAAETVVAQRLGEDPYLEAVTVWLSGLPEGTEFVTTLQIWSQAFAGLEKSFGQREARRLSNCLRARGWERTNQRVNGHQTRGFRPMQDNPDAVIPDGVEQSGLDILGDLA